MISETTINAISRTMQARHAPAWAALRADAEKAKAAGWTRDTVLDVVGRIEALATKQADASVAAFRPLLAPLMTTPAARKVVVEHLDTVRDKILNHLIPGGMTVARAEAVIAEAEAQDRAITDEFADLVADILESPK